MDDTASIDDQKKASEPLPQAELDKLTDQLIEQLKTVYDPEIPVDIYELGLVYKVDVSDHRDVLIEMTLTAPAARWPAKCPAGCRRRSRRSTASARSPSSWCSIRPGTRRECPTRPSCS